MDTKLFKSIIFGPVNSRRLGLSLGINLLPLDSKLCNFDCVYCECGWTDLRSMAKVQFHNRTDIKQNLEDVLISMKNEKLDSITFAGNGEPTMHPEFDLIIDDTIELRNKYFPKCKISVLSNSLMLNNEKVVSALKKIDNPILKLDAGTEDNFQLINQPLNSRTLDWVVKQLLKFSGNLIIQTLFLTGKHNNKIIDNTTEKEIVSWLELLKLINPRKVMIYSIDRATPALALQKISKDKLLTIAKRVELLGIETAIN